MLTNQAISHLWERPRPFTEHPALTHLLSAPTTDPSFPSDHAAAAFAIAFAVLAFSRRGGVLFLAAATLIGVSRIALGMHYPSDVLAGLAVGWVSALLVTRAGRAWIVRLVALLSRVSDPVLRPVSGPVRAQGLFVDSPALAAQPDVSGEDGGSSATPRSASFSSSTRLRRRCLAGVRECPSGVGRRRPDGLVRVFYDPGSTTVVTTQRCLPILRSRTKPSFS